MLFKGKLRDVSRDWKTNMPIISFSLVEGNLKEIEAFQDAEISVEVKKYKRKRNIDANAYLWVLCTKMAEAYKTSKEEIYERMLQDYGYLYQDEDGYITITVKASVDMSKVQGHWKFYKGNLEWASYMMIKGTSEYDTSEMSHFLDMVVQEAKDCGVETLPPCELERMKAQWQNS